MAVDINRIAAAAVESFLGEEGQPAKGSGGKNSRLRGLGGVALGVGLALGVRAAYARVRHFDLEQAAGAIEDKLSR